MTKDWLFNLLIVKTETFLSLSLIQELFQQVLWGPSSKKVAYTTAKMWVKLHDRLAPPLVCHECGTKINAVGYGLISGDDGGIWFSPFGERKNLIPIKIAPHCQEGTLWIIDEGMDEKNYHAVLTGICS